MLTTIAAGRVYNYSHTVGRSAQSGSGFTFPISLALGPGNVVYVLNRSYSGGNPHATKISIGRPGDEELLGEFGREGDGEGQFVWPSGIAVDSDYHVYVSDEWLNRISIFDQEGNFLANWGSSGTGYGELSGPSSLAFDREDNVHVVDTHHHRIQVFTKFGKFLAQYGTYGSGDGELDMPWGITCDTQGNVYVADWNNGRVQKFNGDGAFLASFGKPGTGTGELDHPTDVAVDKDGDVYVVDWANERLQIYSPDGEFITSLRGDAQQLSKWAEWSLSANPDMLKARRRAKSLEPEWYFRLPTAVAFDNVANQIIVADTQRGRLQIYIKEEDYVEPQFNL